MQKAKNEHLLPVEIWRIYPYPDVTPPESFLVVLKGEEGKFVPISIGCPEGQYLVMAMQRVSFPRPLTHNLLQNLLERVKGKVHQLVIHTLKAETFHAYLLIQTQDEVFYLDCRPSDGMIIATLMGVPIFMSPEVMAEAGRELSGLLDITELGEELSGAVQQAGEALDEGDETDELQTLMELHMAGNGALLPLSDAIVTEKVGTLPPSRLETLRAQLVRLVAEEAYEEAARIRDQISSIEDMSESN
ncbi:MAG: bifunctional nuclease family protein [bacterium]|nr:bifunctional nuclease family protein [bacterium]